MLPSRECLPRKILLLKEKTDIKSSFIVMAANLSGISGSQIFRTSDAPKYSRGLTAICTLAGVSWVLAVVLCAQYYIQRRKKVSKNV